jgi:hypothetical protein
MRKLVFLLLIGFSFPLWAQVSPSKYLVQFTDKDQSPYSLSQPEEFLTARAIERRTRQGINIDVSDIPIDPSYIQAVVSTGAKLIIQVKWINGIIIETESQSVLDEIHSLSFVRDLSPLNKKENLKRKKDKFEQETFAPLKMSQSDPVYGDAYNQINMVNGIPLHENGFKGKGMVIAILDAGFTNVDVRQIFDPLWQNNQILGSYNFVNPSADVFGFHYHGSMVLSVMGGNIPGEFLGTAPEASYWLLLTEDVSSEFLIEEYNWMAGAAFADSVGADVINSSLGYSEFDDPYYNHPYTDLDGNTTPVTKAADMAASKGIIVVNSAGNEGDKSWKYLIAPADADSVLTVGAVYANGLITSFSSYGFESDPRVKPNIVAQGGATVLANVNTDALQTANGTSFSSPLIAGMMACLWQSAPQANNMELIHAVEASSSQYQNPDNRYGYGIPNFDESRIALGITNPMILTNDFEVYPNPVSNSALLKWNQTQLKFETLELLDISGRTLYKAALEKEKNEYFLSLKDYKKGIYFVRLGNASRTSTKKIIKVD